MLTSVTDPKRSRGVADAGQPKPPEASRAHDADDDDQRAIVARRNRLVKAALLGLAGATLAAACSDSAVSGADAGADASTTSTATPTGTTPPQPCLSIAIDAEAPDANMPDANEAGPQPCLIPPLDSGSD